MKRSNESDDINSKGYRGLLIVDAAEGKAPAVEGRGEVAAEESTLRVGQRVDQWGLNPLFWSYVKLLSRDVHGLGTLDGIDDSHVLHGKATHRVEVSGVIVHVKPGATKTFGSYVKYILDDGTGLLPCTQYEKSANGRALHQRPEETHKLGELLIVQGKLKRYKGAREVVITSSRKASDPNEETLHWLQCLELAKTAYIPPFQRSEYVSDDLVVNSSQVRPVRCECGAAYAEPIGYCRCIAAPLALDPDFEFRDALLTHLAAKEEGLPPKEHLRFQFARDVRDEPSLKEIAARVVSKTWSDERSSSTTGGGVGRGRAVAGRRGEACSQDTYEVSENSTKADRGGDIVERRKGTDTAIFKAKVIELFRAVMSSFHKDGALHFSDRAKDVYVLVSRNRVLQPSVEALCRERGLALTQGNEIIRALQGSALFHHVPGARIRACLRSM